MGNPVRRRRPTLPIGDESVYSDALSFSIDHSEAAASREICRLPRQELIDSDSKTMHGSGGSTLKTTPVLRKFRASARWINAAPRSENAENMRKARGNNRAPLEIDISMARTRCVGRKRLRGRFRWIRRYPRRFAAGNPTAHRVFPECFPACFPKESRARKRLKILDADNRWAKYSTKRHRSAVAVSIPRLIDSTLLSLLGKFAPRIEYRQNSTYQTP